MNCWSILGIAPTKDVKRINETYDNLLKNKPSKKQMLKVAYDKAVTLANSSIQDIAGGITKANNSNILNYITNYCNDNTHIDNISDIFSRLNYIYSDSSLRFNEKNWMLILNNISFDDENTFTILENKFINFLITHRYIPNKIYVFLNKKFNWAERKNYLYSLYNKNSIDLLLNTISNPLPISYKYLSNINPEIVEEYLSLREKAYIYFKDSNIKESYKNLIAAYSLYKFDFDLLKLLGSYYYEKKDFISALRYFKESLDINKNDLYCLSKYGHILYSCKQYSNAVIYLEKYLANVRNDLDISSLYDLAYSYYYSFDYDKSERLFKILLKLNPKDTSLNNYIKNIKENNSNTKVAPIVRPSYEKYIDSQIALFINNLEEIYSNFNLRTSLNIWENFINNHMNDSKLFYILENELLLFLEKHKYIPTEVLKLLQKQFNWNERYNELITLYPKININFIFTESKKINAPSYKYLANVPNDLLEIYLENRTLASNLIDSKSKDALKYLDLAHNIYTEDCELFRLYGDYFSYMNLTYDAINYYKKGLALDSNNFLCSINLAILLVDVKQYKEALYYLEKEANSISGCLFTNNENFLYRYALCYYYTNDLNNAKINFKKLLKLAPNLHYPKIYLRNINNRLAGRTKKIVNIEVINNPNYKEKEFIPNTLKTISNIFSNMKYLYKHS